jgi:hypothetical protein
MERNFEPMRKQAEARSELTDVNAKWLSTRHLSRTDWKPPNILPVSCMTILRAEVRGFPAPDDLESLNAFTSAFKNWIPFPQFKATAKLWEFLEARFAQSF